MLLQAGKRDDALAVLTSHLAGEEVDPAQRHKEILNFNEKAGWIAWKQSRFRDAFESCFRVSAVAPSHILLFFARRFLSTAEVREMTAEAAQVAQQAPHLNSGGESFNSPPRAGGGGGSMAGPAMVVATESPFFVREEERDQMADIVERLLRTIQSEEARLDDVAEHCAAQFLVDLRDCSTPESPWQQQTASRKKRGDRIILQLLVTLGDRHAESKKAAAALLNRKDFSCSASDFDGSFLQSRRDVKALLLKREDKLEEALAIYAELVIAQRQQAATQCGQMTAAAAQQKATCGRSGSLASEGPTLEQEQVADILSRLIVASTKASGAAPSTATPLVLGGFAKPRLLQLRETVLQHIPLLPLVTVVNLFTKSAVSSGPDNDAGVRGDALSYQSLVPPSDVFNYLLCGTFTASDDLHGAPVDLVEDLIVKSADHVGVAGLSSQAQQRSSEVGYCDRVCQIRRYLEHLLLVDSFPDRDLATALAVVYVHACVNTALLGDEQQPSSHPAPSSSPSDSLFGRTASASDPSSSSTSAARSKLAEFLEHFQGGRDLDIDRVLGTLSRVNTRGTSFDWERCLLYRKQARHAEALDILCRGRLGGLHLAELYCLGSLGSAHHDLPRTGGASTANVVDGSLLGGGDRKNLAKANSGGGLSSSSREDHRQLVLHPNSNVRFAFEEELEREFTQAQQKELAAEMRKQRSHTGGEDRTMLQSNLNTTSNAAASGAFPPESVFQVCYEVLVSSCEDTSTPFSSGGIASLTTQSSSTSTSSSICSLRQILRFATRYCHHLDGSRVVDLLPDRLPTHLLDEFLRTKFLAAIHAQRQQKVEESLSAAAYLRTYKEWHQVRSLCVHLTNERCCPICHKRITTDRAFAVDYKDLRVTHVHCLQATR
ncbi:unnamed protein product [Amoebophrya sp. A25]|nr:unnamed protein product [Amoebophrya sp. A25]|eukprot:GSA25T00025165001.1